MTPVRLKAIADWLLEVSALLAVFPVLDHLVSPGPSPVWLPWVGLIAGIIAGLFGLYLMSERNSRP